MSVLKKIGFRKKAKEAEPEQVQTVLALIAETPIVECLRGWSGAGYFDAVKFFRLSDESEISSFCRNSAPTHCLLLAEEFRPLVDDIIHSLSRVPSIKANLVFGSSDALTAASSNFPEFGKKFLLPDIFSSNEEDIHSNFDFIISQQYKANASGSGSGGSGNVGEDSNSNVVRSDSKGKQGKGSSRLDPYSRHILWVAGLRANEKEVDQVYNSIFELDFLVGAKVAVIKKLLDDDQLDGKFASFDCDLLILVMTVGSGNRCDVERTYGELIYNLPPYFQERVFLLVNRWTNLIQAKNEEILESLKKFAVVSKILLKPSETFLSLDRVGVIENCQVVRESFIYESLARWGLELFKSLVILEVSLYSQNVARKLAAKKTPLKIQLRDGALEGVYLSEEQNEQRVFPFSHVANLRTIHVDKKIQLLLDPDPSGKQKKKNFAFIHKSHATVVMNFVQWAYQSLK